jgi:hypothetical protein
VEGLSKNTKRIIKNIRCPGQDVNGGAPEHQVEVLELELTSEVECTQITLPVMKYEILCHSLSKLSRRIFVC